MIVGNLLNSRANIAAKENLAKVLAAERPLALVGAGLSVPAGFPTWGSLLDEMEQLLPPLDERYVEALRGSGDLLWRAEEYRRLIDERAYQQLLRNRFGTAVTLKPADPTVTLVKLPFRHFITTNYDDVILRAHDAAKLQPPRMLNWSREDDVRAFIFSLRDGNAGRLLLHLHGHHSDPRTIVLTENDYTDRYVRAYDTARKLFAIFTTERVVFVGFSLNDPDLMALLREVNATMRSDEARHFAIMGLEQPVSEVFERNRLRKRYGVEPVFYDNSDRTHQGLLDILKFLQQQSGPPQADKAAPPRRQARSAAPSGPHVIDPEDPQKGMWGGLAKANGRAVTAKVSEIEPDWFETTITVRSTDSRRPLSGEVIFHLHPTIIPSVQSARAKAGSATLKVESYGAYTVGVEADKGKTRLELDLAEIKDAPLMFRMN